MRTTIKFIAVVSVAATLAACGSSDEDVVYVPTVTVDPVSTKY